MPILHRPTRGLTRAALNTGGRAKSKFLSSEQFAKRRLGALDAAGQHCLAAEEGPNENVRVGQSLAFAGQSANEQRSVGQRGSQLRRPVWRRRQRIRALLKLFPVTRLAKK